MPANRADARVQGLRTFLNKGYVYIRTVNTEALSMLANSILGTVFSYSQRRSNGLKCAGAKISALASFKPYILSYPEALDQKYYLHIHVHFTYASIQ